MPRPPRHDEHTEHVGHPEPIGPDEETFTIGDIAGFVFLAMLLPLGVWGVKLLITSWINSLKERREKINKRLDDLEDKDVELELKFKDRPTWDQMKEEVAVRVTAEGNKNA